MSAKILRQKYNIKFARMDRYSSTYAWLIVFGYLLQVALAILAGGALLSLPFGWFLPPVAVVVMLFIGTRFRGLNNIIHECSHSTFSSERATNMKIGKFCAVVLFSSFSDYRDEHLTHHAHLGDYDHDMDLQGIKDLRLHDPLSKRVILRHLVTPLLGWHLPYYLNLNFSARDGRNWVISKAILLLTLSALTFLFPLTVMIFVVLPFTFFYSALNYWADCLDHAGIVASNDDLHSSRNVLASPLLRSLFFPRNDCYHLVHHLFPHVPARFLEASHKVLAQDFLYSTCSNAVSTRDLNRTWEKDFSVIPAE